MAARVVISGVGAVAPNGVGRENFWNAIRQGRSGVRRLEGFDSLELQVRIAGHAASFDEDAWIDPKYR